MSYPTVVIVQSSYLGMGITQYKLEVKTWSYAVITMVLCIDWYHNISQLKCMSEMRRF